LASWGEIEQDELAIDFWSEAGGVRSLTRK